MQKAYKQITYHLITLVSFLGIWVYNVLTPYMSDDYAQLIERVNTKSLMDVFQYGYNHYMTMNGRSNTHMVLRVIMMQDKWFFNICNSICFLVLIQLIYQNIGKRKNYDTIAYLVTHLMVWLYAVEFGQTILWETGSLNYMWSTTLIIGYMTLFQWIGKHHTLGKYQILWYLLLGIMGILSGWCNENTSGALILYLFIQGILEVIQTHKIRLYHVIAFGSTCIGFVLMILAPGYDRRLTLTEESHSGFLGKIARLLQIVEHVEDYFYHMILITMICLIVVVIRRGITEEVGKCGLFVFLAVATCGALLLTPTPMGRVYFGAGIFLSIACVQAIVLVGRELVVEKVLQYGIVAVLMVNFFFTYIGEGAQLMRIYLQNQVRMESIAQQVELGKDIIEVEPFEPFYETSYSYMHTSDVTSEPSHWSNSMFADYYNLGKVVLVETGNKESK